MTEERASLDSSGSAFPQAGLRLRMSGITKRFPGVLANQDVDLEVRAGEIHGLLGENGAGKSTLMNILYGLIDPDEGTIEIDGRPVVVRSPRDALALGVGMVHQHFMLVPDMTVAENVALGLRQRRHPLIDLDRVAEAVDQLSRRHGLRVDPRARIDELPVGMRQRVEILKLLYRQARILVLDEPTAVLTPQEWRDLAAVLESLVSDGRSVVFITHKLDEIVAVADRCTVLRDGVKVGTVPVADTDKISLARMMVGRDVVLRVPRVRVKPGDPVLEVNGVSLTDPELGARLRDVTFQVRAGETVGVAGVDGNGQQELVEVLLGLRERDSGQIRLLGRSVPHLNAGRELRAHVGIIPEDRHGAGIALPLSVRDNLLLRDFGEPRFSRRGILRLDAIRQHCQRLVRDYDVRTPSLNVRMRQLSGGNQQRAVIARELHREPQLLVVAQPTRGLDVGAVEYVYGRLAEHKRAGGATLLFSSELEEVLTLSDRIAVISGGRLPRILDAGAADMDTLGLLMAGELAPGA